MTIKSPSDGRTLDEIHLQDLKVCCTIGIHPEEATRTQLLQLNLILYLDTRAAASSGRLQQSVDYAALARELNFFLTHAHFRLLESAAEALARFILSPAPSDKAHASIEAVDLHIIKPEALGGVGLPAIRIRRERKDLSLPREAAPSPFGPQLIFAAPEAALFRWTLAPREEASFQSGDWQLTALLAQSSGLSCAGKFLLAGEVVAAAGRQDALRLHNASEQARSLLLVGRRPRRAASSPELFN